jgi:hypothetical protein
MNRNSVVKGIKDRSFKELCAHVVEDMKRLDVPGVSIAVWAADSARLKTARELLEEVLGEDDDDEEAIDGLADDGEGDEG